MFFQHFEPFQRRACDNTYGLAVCIAIAALNASADEFKRTDKSGRLPERLFHVLDGFMKFPACRIVYGVRGFAIVKLHVWL